MLNAVPNHSTKTSSGQTGGQGWWQASSVEKQAKGQGRQQPKLIQKEAKVQGKLQTAATKIGLI